MDGRSFVKCLRNSALIDADFTTAEADLVFTKCKARRARKIDFDTFVRALEEVAVRRDMTEGQLLKILSLGGGYGVCEKELPEQESFEAAGPERFFYDTSLYTGTHKHGGPSASGSGSKEVPPVDFKELVNRDRRHDCAGEQRIKSPRECNITDQGPVLLGRIRRPVAALKGPERFFYDKSTYTGTHRNGGPDMHGSGIPKEGYGDLKELVCRDHTQDDDLNRRRRAEASAAIAGEKQSPRQMRNSPRKMPNSPTPMQHDVRYDLYQSMPLPVLLGSMSQHGPHMAASKLR